MNIIFMGTPEFAVPTLRSIINSSHTVSAVFTSLPKPKNRGMKVEKTSVHNLAETFNIPVYTLTSIKNQYAFDLIRYINADIIVVVAYGFIIPKNILELKKYGCINVHPSRLPKYRGASPIQNTILNGDTDTSVCVIQMDEGMDTGDIIAQHDINLRGDITSVQLEATCAQIGADLVLKLLNADMQCIQRMKQSESEVIYANKIRKEDGLIDWYDSSIVIDRKIRALNPWPSAYFIYQNEVVKITKSKGFSVDHSIKLLPGSITKDFGIVCANGVIFPERVQRPSKNEIQFSEFIRFTKATKLID